MCFFNFHNFDFTAPLKVQLETIDVDGTKTSNWVKEQKRKSADWKAMQTLSAKGLLIICRGLGTEVK